jgi:hypothetical protein
VSGTNILGCVVIWKRTFEGSFSLGTAFGDGVLTWKAVATVLVSREVVSEKVLICVILWRIKLWCLNWRCLSIAGFTIMPAFHGQKHSLMRSLVSKNQRNEWMVAFSTYTFVSFQDTHGPVRRVVYLVGAY